jgi:cysteine desulfurase
MTTEIYLDGNATSAVLPAAIAAAIDTMGRRFGNPSSTHATGLQAKAMLDEVRACAVRLLGVGDGRLMFNSGATEGIQTSVLSALVALRERRERRSTSAICWSTAPPNTRPCLKAWRTGTACWA